MGSAKPNWINDGRSELGPSSASGGMKTQKELVAEIYGKTSSSQKPPKTGDTCELLRAVRSVMGWQRNLNGECDRIPARKSWKCVQMLQHVLGYLMLSLLVECHWSRECDASNSMGPWAAGAPKKPEYSCNFYLQLGRLKLVQFHK